MVLMNETPELVVLEYDTGLQNQRSFGFRLAISGEDFSGHL
jgi:hypothetical protein